MLETMDEAFREFAAAIPLAERVSLPGGEHFVFRFRNKDIRSAIVMKLSLVQSTLRAALVLLEHGHVTQQAMLQRVVDELCEDILFLVLAITNDEITLLHQQYLDAFWAEEFGDSANLTASHQSRRLVPRKKIHTYIASLLGEQKKSEREVAVAKVLSRAYSGFVHGAAPHIMESYGGDPPHFHTHGMAGTPRTREYGLDLWNYMYRALLSHIYTGKAFGAVKRVATLTKNKLHFEAAMGKTY